jgi:hypothetical protein
LGFFRLSLLKTAFCKESKEVPTNGQDSSSFREKAGFTRELNQNEWAEGDG